MKLGAARNAVEREIENVEIAHPAGVGSMTVLVSEWPRQNKRHRLLAEAAMRAQAMPGEPR